MMTVHDKISELSDRPKSFPGLDEQMIYQFGMH